MPQVMGHDHGVLVDGRRTADFLQRFKAKLQARNPQEIGSTVFEAACRGGRQSVISRLRHGLENTASSVVHLVQNGCAGVANEQCADARGETEHLVKGENNKIGGVFGQVKIVSGGVGRDVEKDEPLSRAVKPVLSVDEVNPILRVHFAGKVLFQGIGKEIVDLVV